MITISEKIWLDVVYILWEGSIKYIVFVWDDLSRYDEAQVIKEASSDKVVRFLHKKVIYHHRVPLHIVMDSGFKNIGFIKKLFENMIYMGFLLPYITLIE